MTWPTDQQRAFLAGAIATTVVVLFCVASYVSYPTPIESYRSLAPHIGNRVKFNATFVGHSKPGQVILLSGSPVLMETRKTGQFSWPEDGDTIHVIGRVERGDRYYTDIDYVVRDAEWEIRNLPSK
ncbi:hypothetical protein SH528x_003031 [Novipirellula sp. SH528]|uniref:hypothetical protein n=1 Tax=Novipirellula sp. SH528 TaxID=3454466 RepID=UPI003F9EC30F